MVSIMRPEQTLRLIQLYHANYPEIARNNQDADGRNLKLQMWADITAELNRAFDTQFTVEQYKKKVQNVQCTSRQKLGSGKRNLGEAEVEYLRLFESDKITVEVLAQRAKFRKGNGGGGGGIDIGTDFMAFFTSKEMDEEEEEGKQRKGKTKLESEEDGEGGDGIKGELEKQMEDSEDGDDDDADGEGTSTTTTEGNSSRGEERMRRRGGSSSQNCYRSFDNINGQMYSNGKCIDGSGTQMALALVAPLLVEMAGISDKEKEEEEKGGKQHQIDGHQHCFPAQQQLESAQELLLAMLNATFNGIGMRGEGGGATHQMGSNTATHQMAIKQQQIGLNDGMTALNANSGSSNGKSGGRKRKTENPNSICWPATETNGKEHGMATNAKRSRKAEKPMRRMGGGFVGTALMENNNNNDDGEGNDKIGDADGQQQRGQLICENGKAKERRSRGEAQEEEEEHQQQQQNNSSAERTTMALNGREDRGGGGDKADDDEKKNIIGNDNKKDKQPKWREEEEEMFDGNGQDNNNRLAQQQTAGNGQQQPKQKQQQQQQEKEKVQQQHHCYRCCCCHCHSSTYSTTSSLSSSHLLSKQSASNSVPTNRTTHSQQFAATNCYQSAHQHFGNSHWHNQQQQCHASSHASTIPCSSPMSSLFVLLERLCVRLEANNRILSQIADLFVERIVPPIHRMASTAAAAVNGARLE